MQLNASTRNSRYIQEIVEEAGHMPGLSLNHLPRLLQRFGAHIRRLHDFRRVHYRGQRITKFVGEHGNEFLSSSRRRANFVFIAFALGYIHKRHDDANNQIAPSNWITPVFREERRSISAGENFVVRMRRETSVQDARDRAILGRMVYRELSVVKERVNRLSHHFVWRPISQHPHAGWIHERTNAIRPESDDGFTCGFQQEPYSGFTFGKLHLSPLELSDV